MVCRRTAASLRRSRRNAGRFLRPRPRALGRARPARRDSSTTPGGPVPPGRRSRGPGRRFLERRRAAERRSKQRPAPAEGPRLPKPRTRSYASARRVELPATARRTTAKVSLLDAYGRAVARESSVAVGFVRPAELRQPHLSVLLDEVEVNAVTSPQLGHIDVVLELCRVVPVEVPLVSLFAPD